MLINLTHETPLELSSVISDRKSITSLCLLYTSMVSLTIATRRNVSLTVAEMVGESAIQASTNRGRSVRYLEHERQRRIVRTMGAVRSEPEHTRQRGRVPTVDRRACFVSPPPIGRQLAPYVPRLTSELQDVRRRRSILPRAGRERIVHSAHGDTVRSDSSAHRIATGELRPRTARP